MARRSFVVVVVLCLGCREATEEVVDEGPPPVVSTDFARLSDVLAGILKTDQVLLYEGLPGEFWEPQLREQELRQKETLAVHGYLVYDEPQTPTGADAEKLTALCSARESYSPCNNRKKCGGFSADYCVEWTAGQMTTKILICLECGDVMIFGPQCELHCDLTPEAARRLAQLVSPYHKNRPSEKPDP
jgi:hypothetical protein